MDLGLDDEQFLAMAPAALELLVGRLLARERRLDVRAALICSVLANCNRNPEQKPEPFTVADFMPGAPSEEDDLREFVQEIERGRLALPDRDQVEAFKKRIASHFSPQGHA